MAVRLPLELSVANALESAGFRVVASRARSRQLDLFDTTDRRLAAAGGELRRGADGRWAWRRAPLGHPKLAAAEWTARGPGAAEQAATWVSAYSRGAALGPRAHLRAVTRTHTVTTADGEVALTIDEERLDERRGDEWAPRLRRAAVALGADEGQAAAALRALRAGVIGDVPTLALVAGGRVRAPRLALTTPASTDSRSLLQRSLTLSTLQWLYFDSELRAGSADALRKVRVAVRRTRSDLLTFRPLLVREWADELRARLGELGTAIGSARDGDVRMDRLAALVDRLPAAQAGAAAPLLAAAAADRASAATELFDVLDGDPYMRLLDEVIAAATAPHWLDTEHVPDVAALARRTWRRLRAYVAGLDGAPAEEALHRVRILAKRARYAADAATPACGNPAAASALLLADLQTVLGDHHDAAVNREWLAAQAARHPEMGFIAGQLAAMETRTVGETEVAWRSAWRQASRRQGWRWLRG